MPVGDPEEACDLFVAHAPADETWVEGYLLPTLGLPADRVLTPAGFRLGAPLVVEFERAVRMARYTVLVLTPAYLADDWSRYGGLLGEFAAVAEGRARLIPLLLQPCAMPLHLQHKFRVSLDCTDPAAWARAAARLRALLDHPGPPSPVGAPCPYPGMVPFQPDDARFFYGRASEIRQMVQHLRHSRFLLIIGPSGCGKSSLVGAGLVPALEQSHFWPPGHWAVARLRPGPAPLDALAELLGGDAVLADPGAAVAARLARPPGAGRLLIVVDQGEEVFTLAAPAERARFWAAVRALRALPTCAVVLTLRADFYPDLLDCELWPVEASQRLDLGRLRGDALRQAIQEPAAAVGVYLEPALLERLLADAADEPGALPLLQETLVLLWGEIQGRFLPAAAYTRLGGPERSGLALALTRRADAVLTEVLPAAAWPLARRIFLRLVQFGEGRPDTRRQQPGSALAAADDDPALLESTLRVLADHRLLTLSGDAADSTRRVDIAHEALLEGWPTLGRWIVEYRAAEQVRRRLEEQAAAWARQAPRVGPGDQGVLNAAALAEAADWLDRPAAAAVGYTTTLREFVASSQAALTQAREREDTMRQREEAVHRREREQAIAQADQARAARAQTAQVLAATAVMQLEQDPELGVLLARAAVILTRERGEPVVPQAEDALHQALLRSAVRQTLRGHAGGVLCVAWGPAGTPAGRTLLTTGYDRTARLWDPATGAAPRLLYGHRDAVHAAAWRPDGQQIVTVGSDGTARIWDAAAGTARHTFHCHDDRVLAVAWGPAGTPAEQVLATAGEDGTLRLWDAATGSPLGPPRPHPDAVTGLAWHPAGRCLATAAGAGAVCIWDLAETGLPSESRGSGGPRPVHAGRAARVAYSPDGTLLLTAGTDGVARLWDAESGAPRGVLAGHAGAITGIAWRADGQALATAGCDGTVRIWSTGRAEVRRILRGHTGACLDVAYSSDGRFLASAGGPADSTVRVWDSGSGEELPTLRGHTDRVTGAAYSPDGQRILTAGADGSARIWDAATGALLATLRGHRSGLTRVAWNADGDQVLTCAEDGLGLTWDVATGQVCAQERVRPRRARTVVLSPDNRRLATLDETVVRLWDRNPAPGSSAPPVDGPGDGATLWERFALVHEGLLAAAAWDPAGRYLATTSYDGTACIWDADTGQAQALLRGHTTAVTLVAWGPAGTADGPVLATAGEDGTIKIWAAEMPAGPWRERCTLRGPREGLAVLAWSPDGTRLVTASLDRTARQYAVAVDALLALAATRVTRDLTPAEQQAYQGRGPERA